MEPVDVCGGFWRYQNIIQITHRALLGQNAVVRRSWNLALMCVELVLILIVAWVLIRWMGTLLDLLQKVVLLLTHHDLPSFFLALFQLIL